MATALAVNDRVTFEVIADAEKIIEQKLDCDVMHFFGEIRSGVESHVRDVVELLAARPDKKAALGVCITTPGGQAEVVEKCVEILRHHYDQLYFIVPRMAMSAGTIFCMAGDKIYMDYASSLGPIDPQVPDKEGKYLVPALGYLDKVAELIEKSRNDTITPAEFMLIEKQDLAMLRFYEQARELSKTLLKQWLTKYKFKDWVEHQTTNPGMPVTEAEKVQRAEEIATLLSDNGHWSSHGRFIGMGTLRNQLRLKIEDFGADPELQEAARRYCEVFSTFCAERGIPWYVYNRHTTN